jgi:inward rectifier potassium channel
VSGGPDTGRARRAARAYGDRPVIAIGLRPRPLSDLYHFLVTSPWRRLFVLIFLAYLAVNALFALAYLALGDAIENARPGSFADAFFFSVQTLATIGYGKLAPRTTAANLLVVIEVMVGGTGLALMTGLVFAKFARPTARVLFSRFAIVTTWDGVPSLVFRMANARASQIVEAHLGLTVVRDERTAEGDPVRRVHDLRLRRDRNPLFALTWTAIHPLDEASPLAGLDAAGLAAAEVQLVVSLTGFDESLAQTIYARHAYLASDVRFGVRFRDVLGVAPDGSRMVDYRRFHEVEPVEASAPPAARGAGAARP